MQFQILSIVALLSAAVSASVLSTTNIATVLATVTDQTALTIPADALTAMGKLGTGGATASTLSTADVAAISTARTNALAGNTASKANLADGTGSAGAIAFVVNKITIHATETAQAQIGLAAGTTESDTAVNLLISNVGVLNVNLKAAAAKKRSTIALRALKFKA